jgi:hypothetical protein
LSNKKSNIVKEFFSDMLKCLSRSNVHVNIDDMEFKKDPKNNLEFNMRQNSTKTCVRIHENGHFDINCDVKLKEQKQPNDNKVV